MKMGHSCLSADRAGGPHADIYGHKCVGSETHKASFGVCLVIKMSFRLSVMHQVRVFTKVHKVNNVR